MFIVMFLGVLIISYVVTFKNDFSEEHLEKAGPFIFIASGLMIVLGVVTSLVGR